MNDIERARQKRISVVAHADGELVIETANRLINVLLPSGLEEGQKVTALLIAILAIVDATGADRETIAEAAKMVAARFPEIELVPA